jgi:rod shape-determining protein MreC
MNNNASIKRDSFSLLKRFKKGRVTFRALVYCGLIAVFYTNFGNDLLGKCRFFLNSTQVIFAQYSDDLERYFLNLCYLISNDVQGTLLNLQKRNLELQQEVETLKNLQLRNEELEKLLSLKDSTTFSMVAAKVVSVFSNDFSQSFILNVGAVDGVSVDDVVRNSNGIIGRIIEVHDSWSRVLLITDMNSCIPIKIGELSTNAIMSGSNSNELLISAIYEDVPIKEGDDVKTSGYGICENIPVGKILKNNGRFIIKSNVDFNSLKYVVVIKKVVNKIAAEKVETKKTETEKTPEKTTGTDRR